MRWFVEISPLGANEGPKLKWCVEAAGWQPALKDARALRGEEGPLGGFSIELLDDGARAVDPVARIRYVIREAPPSTPITHTKAGPVGGSAANAPPAKVDPAKTDLAKVDPTKADLAKVEPTKADLAKVEPAKADLAKVEPTKADLAKVDPTKTDLAKVDPAKAAPAAQAEPAAQAAADDEVDIPIDADEPATKATAAPPLPGFQILGSREESPSATSPLTYREQVYVVDPAASDADIERLIRARFQAIEESLAKAAPGRFVNLAIFDHTFTGKPARPPRATLTWKDWRGTPEVRFPASEGAGQAPSSFAAPTSASQPVPQPSIRLQTAAEPAAAKTPAETRGTSMPPTEPVPTPLAPTEPAPEAVRPTEPAPVPAPAPAAAPASTPKPAETAAAETSQPPAAPRVEAAAPERPSVPVSAAPKTKPAATAAPKTMPAATPAPKTKPAATPAPAPAPPPREAVIPAVKTAAEAGPRVAGDELISELFEACGDLQFVRDSLEGADFVLGLALEKIPSELGLVSLFDINRREFVVVRQAGGPRSVVLSRLPERSGLAQAAMRKRAAIVVPDAAKEPRALDDRFRTLGIELRSMMIAPVEQSGRYLGLIELVNPIDGRPFTEGDGHALTYIGEQFSEFVAEQGVVLEPQQVIERHQKR